MHACAFGQSSGSLPSQEMIVSLLGSSLPHCSAAHARKALLGSSSPHCSAAHARKALLGSSLPHCSAAHASKAAHHSNNACELQC
eukprot:1106027-Pelagomonas_calceolata.AAC.2